MAAPKRSSASAPPSKDDDVASAEIAPEAPAPEAPAEVTPEAPAPEAPKPPVKGRWVGAEPCFNPEQGLIEPGDEFVVSAEQLDDPNTPVVPLDQEWTRPDPDRSDA